MYNRIYRLFSYSYSWIAGMVEQTILFLCLMILTNRETVKIILQIVEILRRIAKMIRRSIFTIRRVIEMVGANCKITSPSY